MVAVIIIAMVLAYMLINRILVWMMPVDKVELTIKDNKTFMQSLSFRKVSEAIIEYFKSLTKKGG
tara:strand:- start:1075 stop:1269 length:195 start_codon:yes stop_codon:yes gene_type:complete